MTRRVTAGVAGGAGVAGLQTFTTTITSANNLDITVAPTGTGRFLISGNAQLQSQSDLRFSDLDSSNWVAFQAPEVVGTNVTWTLPATDGTSRQVITTDGSGILSWQTPTILIEDNTTDSATHFVTLTTANTDTTITSIRRSSSKLTYRPSTGDLTATRLTASENISFGTGGTLAAGQIFSDANWGVIIRAKQSSPTTAELAFQNAGGTERFRIDNSGHLVPGQNNTYDLGTTALRWRNIYTNDLHLSNGIGDYTVIEGKEDLFLVNNKTKKSFKFALIEVDPIEVPPRSSDT